MMFGIVLPWVTWLLLRTEADRSGRERPSTADRGGRANGRAAEAARLSVLVAFLLGWAWPSGSGRCCGRR